MKRAQERREQSGPAGPLDAPNRLLLQAHAWTTWQVSCRLLAMLAMQRIMRFGPLVNAEDSLPLLPCLDQQTRELQTTRLRQFAGLLNLEVRPRALQLIGARQRRPALLRLPELLDRRAAIAPMGQETDLAEQHVRRANTISVVRRHGTGSIQRGQVLADGHLAHMILERVDRVARNRGCQAKRKGRAVLDVVNRLEIVTESHHHDRHPIAAPILEVLTDEQRFARDETTVKGSQQMPHSAARLGTVDEQDLDRSISELFENGYPILL